MKRHASLIASESSGKDSVYLSGSALAQAVLGEATARDLARLIPAVIAVLGVMLFLSFRHPVPALLSLMEIGVSLIWMSGLMGLTGQPVFVTTLVLPVVLICVGVSDDVYALGHYFNEAERAEHSTVEETIVAAFSSAARPIGMTAVSTVVGLLSMAAVSLNPLRVFGLFGSAAIVFSTLFTFSLAAGTARAHETARPLERRATRSRRTPGNVGAAFPDGPSESATRGHLRSPRRGVRRSRDSRASASTIVGSETCQLRATSCEATGSSTRRWRGPPRSN